MKLSIVTTFFRSAATVEAFYRRSVAAAESVADAIELIFVNDGSPDDSLKLALALQHADARVVVVDLSHNFGHHKAMMTGLAHATGDLVFLIDCDLEEQPEDLPLLYRQMLATDCDVAYAVQSTRRGGAFERASGAAFFSVMDWLSDTPLPRNLMTMRLMTRDYVVALLQHRDREFVISHLWAVTGFRQLPVAVTKHALSPSTYTLSRRVGFAVKIITTTSTKLLHLILFAGVAIFGLSIVLVLYYLGRYFIHGVGVTGYTSLIVSIWFLGGLIMLVLGILGVYIANISVETKQRPLTTVRRIYRAAPNADTPP